ncbi:MAG: hypothetical protein M1836_004775 [Candelina mexicana]|nr:MAG: hypothetical protein M1836_004775 [Candelina mexicana]
MSQSTPPKILLSQTSGPHTPPSRPSSVTNEQSAINLLTPEQKIIHHRLKRKASDLAEKPSPKESKLYLKHRLLWLQSEISKVDHMRANLPVSATEYRDQLRTELDGYEEEEAFILKMGKFIVEDLQDSLGDTEQAYVHDLYRQFRLASKKSLPAKYRKTADHPEKFAEKVEEHLGSSRVVNGEKQRWCVVLGTWINHTLAKCAHLVPKSYESRELEYLFGTGDAALSDKRNGLTMNRVVEEAFDNGHLTIVPWSTVASTPTEWRVLLLKHDNLNDTFYVDPISRHAYKWRAMDEQNPLRHTLPTGTIWASPEKKDGYLRRSTLRALARHIGDIDLPAELVEAGTFIDTEPGTASQVQEKVAAREVALFLRDKVTGKGKGRVTRSDSEDSDSN